MNEKSMSVTTVAASWWQWETSTGRRGEWIREMQPERLLVGCAGVLPPISKERV